MKFVKKQNKGLYKSEQVKCCEDKIRVCTSNSKFYILAVYKFNA